MGFKLAGAPGEVFISISKLSPKETGDPELQQAHDLNLPLPSGRCMLHGMRSAVASILCSGPVCGSVWVFQPAQVVSNRGRSIANWNGEVSWKVLEGESKEGALWPSPQEGGFEVWDFWLGR